MNFLYISKQELNDIFSDCVRFVSHIALLHFITVGIEGTDEFFSGRILRTLIYTVLAITIYHVLIKKTIFNKKKEKNNLYLTPH